MILSLPDEFVWERIIADVCKENRDESHQQEEKIIRREERPPGKKPGVSSLSRRKVRC